MNSPTTPDIDGLVQDCSNSIAYALKLLQSYTKPSICCSPRGQTLWSILDVVIVTNDQVIVNPTKDCRTTYIHCSLWRATEGNLSKTWYIVIWLTGAYIFDEILWISVAYNSPIVRSWNHWNIDWLSGTLILERKLFDGYFQISFNHDL